MEFSIMSLWGPTSSLKHSTNVDKDAAFGNGYYKIKFWEETEMTGRWLSVKLVANFQVPVDISSVFSQHLMYSSQVSLQLHVYKFYSNQKDDAMYDDGEKNLKSTWRQVCVGGCQQSREVLIKFAT